ncbi:hypothetical protein LR48_Vigan01g112200 [Vigna angularis]|uniref:Uncharacterized protein n=1 Tax=Phaseolus angularis TaxID=3914 RepID=A0A0L9TMA6_PHAAN|nr:hypothetical protein LR48_Vigan01g112200 [Vigna angularis]
MDVYRRPFDGQKSFGKSLVANHYRGLSAFGNYRGPEAFGNYRRAKAFGKYRRAKAFGNYRRPKAFGNYRRAEALGNEHSRVFTEGRKPSVMGRRGHLPKGKSLR